MPYAIECANSIYADEIANLLRRSIVELCAADHGGDPDLYAPWIANKTGEWVAKWVSGPGRTVVAINASRHVVGVAQGTPEGEVLLNYVLPDYRFQGVSKALMRELEAYFKDLGIERAVLTSTLTAERFYEAIGYKETGQTEQHLGHSVKVLRKRL